MASQDDEVWRESVALSVSRLQDKSETRRRQNSRQKARCGYSSVAMTAIGISLILLGVLDVVFGTLCASAGVRYGATGDTLIRPWRALPLGCIAVACGALGIHLTRRLQWKPRRQAIVTMLLSTVCSAWAAVVVFSFSFDVAEQSTAYQALKKEMREALASQNVLFGFRKDKINLANRDLAYFSGAVSFATLSAIIAAAQAVMAGFYINDPGEGRKSERERIPRRSGPASNIISSKKVFVSYKNKAALAAAIIQIVCGCSVVLGLGLALATEHNPAWASYVISHGIIFITSGIVSAISSTKKTRLFVTASMIMSLCACVAAVNMVCSDVAFIINSNSHPTSGRSKIDKLSLTTKLFAIHGIDLFVNLIELVTAAVLAGLGCHVTCEVAGKADDSRCLVSYVEVGQTERSGGTEYNRPTTDNTEGGYVLQLPDILHDSMIMDDDSFGQERPQYMTEALASNA
ncbi:uncharacterized protein LOC135489220 [Lineus longissimus]|uniref:uncharacterized protein LOC135489220 n=1 Tax=Lineus longissimus TaxID=88925 RepID=UPI002B4CD880